MGTYRRRDRIGDVDRAGFEEAQAFFEYSPVQETLPLEDVGLSSELSCRSGLTAAQKRFFGRVFSVLGISGLLAPTLLLFSLGVIFWAAFAALVFWRLVLLLGGHFLLSRRAPVVELPEGDDLPIYTIMIAAYDEAPVMPQLANALASLNWPSAKLDIMLLLEADDEETLQAALRAEFPTGSRLIVVPDGNPRTKPRALNCGLKHARGEFVCIYDAEDRPHPNQLREAYGAFLRADDTLACVQAPLVGTGNTASIIAAHWSLEYAVQFRLLMPALAALGAPIPIGGTSNHFRRMHLRDSGAWDAWNVTEDADLGLRFARLGWRVGMIKNGTLEDAPRTLGIWRRQRSRWIKGFIQTWLVLMRNPKTVARQMGLKNFVCMQLTLGGAILAPIAHGPFFLFVVLALVANELSVGQTGWALMTAGYLVTLMGDLTAPQMPFLARLRAAFTRPLYWPLHSIAAGQALYEMVVRPHYWAKTPHMASEESFTECSTGSSQSD